MRNFRPGDRVIIPATLGCGRCNYCRACFYSQCKRPNAAGPLGLDGLQADYARVPMARQPRQAARRDHRRLGHHDERHPPEQFFTQKVPVTSAIDAYHHFDRHEHGWLKIKARTRHGG